MPAFHLVKPGDVLYTPRVTGGTITRFDVLVVDRLKKRVHASIAVLGANVRSERWLIDSELEPLRRTPPRAASSLQ